MNWKKAAVWLLTLAVVLHGGVLQADASHEKTLNKEQVSVCAAGQFSMNVSAGKTRKADTSFSMEAGESVTIKASYSPFSASVDFGLIAPDGDFYYVSVKNGSIDQTITITERGEYTFAVRNNSTSAVSVSGYVSY